MHYQLGEYREALKEFKEAYRLKQDPSFLYNIAQCHRQLREYSEAIKLYGNYLREAPDADNRDEVERQIRDLKAAAEKQRQEQASAPPVAVPEPIRPLTPVPAAAAPGPTAATPGPAAGAAVPASPIPSASAGPAGLDGARDAQPEVIADPPEYPGRRFGSAPPVRPRPTPLDAIHSLLGRHLHGDLGNSITLHTSVASLIAARYPYTLALTVCALGFALILALPAGILAAVHRGRWIDQLLSMVSLFGFSVPAMATVSSSWFSPSSSAGSRSPAQTPTEPTQSTGLTSFSLLSPWAHRWPPSPPAWSAPPCWRSWATAPPVNGFFASGKVKVSRLPRSRKHSPLPRIE